jgi:hypothetical protein
LKTSAGFEKVSIRLWNSWLPVVEVHFIILRAMIRGNIGGYGLGSCQIICWAMAR